MRHEAIELFQTFLPALTYERISPVLPLFRIPESRKPARSSVYARLEKVRFIEDHEVLGFHSHRDRFGGESYALVQDDPTSSALRKMRLGRTDAHHLMLAIRDGCDRFITYDNGILSRSSEIESAFSIKVVRPSELLAEIQQASAHTP